MAPRYYPYLSKDNNLTTFKNVADIDFNIQKYGDIQEGEYPYTSSIVIEHFPTSSVYTESKKHIYALKNTLNNYKFYSEHYAYSSSYGDKATQKLTLISIPSIFYGSSIDKGSVKLSFYVSGTLIGKLEDINKNGELLQTTGSSGYDQVAGVVLYNEGFILLTGSWNINSTHTETYIYNSDNTTGSDNPKWIHWGTGINKKGTSNYTTASSFELDFEGVNYINTLTMFAHAEKGELNHSNNPTYIKYGQETLLSPKVTDISYSEYNKLEIKNTIKYAYDNFTGSLEKQTYISKIGIYDENKNLIAIAKLAKPIRKPEGRDLTFKLKLDI